MSVPTVCDIIIPGGIPEPTDKWIVISPSNSNKKKEKTEPKKEDSVLSSSESTDFATRLLFCGKQQNTEFLKKLMDTIDIDYQVVDYLTEEQLTEQSNQKDQKRSYWACVLLGEEPEPETIKTIRQTYGNDIPLIFYSPNPNSTITSKDPTKQGLNDIATEPTLLKQLLQKYKQ